MKNVFECSLEDGDERLLPMLANVISDPRVEGRISIEKLTQLIRRASRGIRTNGPIHLFIEIRIDHLNAVMTAPVDIGSISTKMIVELPSFYLQVVKIEILENSELGLPVDPVHAWAEIRFPAQDSAITDKPKCMI